MITRRTMPPWNSHRFEKSINANCTASVKYWETIANNVSKAGWSWGCVSALDREGRTIWIADATTESGSLCVPMKT